MELRSYNSLLGTTEQAYLTTLSFVFSITQRIKNTVFIIKKY
jgi:hypothetical protein